MDFFQYLCEREREALLGSGSQNDTWARCQFCGGERDDVIIGVCAVCAGFHDPYPAWTAMRKK